jgi:hypothetical protein
MSFKGKMLNNFSGTATRPFDVLKNSDTYRFLRLGSQDYPFWAKGKQKVGIPMTALEKLIKSKPELLELAAYLKNVCKAYRVLKLVRKAEDEIAFYDALADN